MLAAEDRRSPRRPRLCLCLSTWLVLTVSLVNAQQDPDPSEGARIRSGSLAFTPAVVFSFGHDSNVYREPTSFSDTEMFVVPQIEGWWTRPGFRTTLRAAVEVVRFGHNVGATNRQAGVRLDRTGSRFRPFVDLNQRNTNANPAGFEVGYKSLRLENDLVTGAALAISPRTQFRLQARLTETRWDADARYLTSSLREKLNRNTSTVSSGLAYALTPLTSIGASVDLTQDRFRFSPERDGDTARVLGTVEFGRLALLFGSASVGYMQFSSPTSGAADFKGPATAVNLGYGSPDGTLIRFLMSRDLQYSFDTDLSYYVMNGTSVTASRRLGNRWDIAGFFNRFVGDYRPAGSVAGIGKVDRLNEFGGAIAYRMGRWTRIGLTTEQARKSGDWGYEARRVVGFLTYGSGRFQRLDRPTPFER